MTGWLTLLGLWAWFTAPLWRTPDRLFVGKLATDGVVTPWFITTFAQRWGAGEDTSVLWGMDWPKPWPRALEFPSVADAMLLSPLVWLAGWPAWWNLGLCLAVGINALGVAALLRVLGSGPLGMVCGGVLAMLARPVWADLVMARLNVAFPGLVTLALAALVLTLPAPGRRLGTRLGAAVGAALAGCGAALVYPPFLLLLAPVGLVLVVGAWLRACWGGGPGRWFLAVGLALSGVLGALALAWEELMGIAANPGRPPDCSAHDCMDRYHSVSLDHLALSGPIPFDGLTLSGMHLAGWLLLATVLLARRRVEATAVALLSLVLAGLALGPCPALARDVPWEHPVVDWLVLALDPVWCQGGWLHDWGRFASAAAVGVAVGAGLGLDGIFRRGRAWAAVATLAGLLCTGWAARDLWTEILDPGRWHRAPIPVTAAWLIEGGKVGPVVELPYDRKLQFLSLLASPENPRRNPLKGHPRGPDGPVALRWLDALALGVEPGVDRPSLEAIAVTGLRFVFFDPARCVGSVPRAACSVSTQQALEGVLGEGQELDGGVLVWALPDLH